MCAALAVMTTLTSYSVTLYRLFCQATGANGTTQRVATGSTKQAAREVTVLFDTNVAPGLPWRFVPLQRSVKLHLGVQCDAGQGRTLFQEDPVLLFHRGAAGRR